MMPVNKKERVEFNPVEIGFTLVSDVETLWEVERTNAEAFLAREFPSHKLWK